MAHLTASEFTAITCAAVTDGVGPGDDGLERVAASLSGAAGPDDVRRHLSTLAALLYARTEPIDDSLVDVVASLVTAAGPADDLARTSDALFAYFATTANAPRAWLLLNRMLQSGDDPATTRRLLHLVRTFVQWRDDLVDLDQVLALAEGLPDPEPRAELLDHAVDRLVFSAAEQFTPERLERLRHAFAEATRYRYVLANLAARHTLPPDSRAWIETTLQGTFPYRHLIADVISRSPARVLIVVNIRLGQGDEIVRVAPLLQSLLDGNPQLRATVVSPRNYLWDAPRVTTAAIDDAAATDAVFSGTFDGVIELFQPDQPERALRLEVHDALERLVARCHPAFLVRAELGRARPGDLGIPSEFLFQHVAVHGQEIAAATGLDRRWLPNIYEPTLRLLAELGMPARVADDAPSSPLALVGRPSADARRVWSTLVSDASARGTKMALVNPFGGADAVKGFRADARLGDDLAGLVDEGFIVVVLPNGTAWGRRAAIEGALAHLDADTRARIRIAPDPAEQDPTLQLRLEERPELPYADRVMRLFKYFAATADLVVTVEGWMAHLAYNLGRPFRLCLAAGSFTPDWFPHGRGREQRLMPALSTRPRPRAVAPPLLCDANAPPLVHPPRKRLLELAMAGLGRPGNERALSALRHALASPDPDLRIAAIHALADRDDPAAHVLITAALTDREPRLVRAAAERLLRAGVDCTRELGPRYRDVLAAHVAIVRGDWAAVRQGGQAVLPAVFAAARSRSIVIARDARTFLLDTLTPFMPEAARPSASRDRVATSPVDDLGVLLMDALSRPARVVATRVMTLARAIESDDEATRLLALAGTAAVLYSRPDLVPATLVDVLARGCASPRASDTFAERALLLLRNLASGPHAARVWTHIREGLSGADVRPSLRTGLLEALRELLDWHDAVVGLDDLVRLAEADTLAPHLAFLFNYGVDRLVHANPRACTRPHLARIGAVFSEAPRYPHVMRTLLGRAELPDDGRAFIEETLRGAFPFAAAAQSILLNGPVRVFIMMNTAMGLGDEVVRVGLLAQALLDANPALTIVVATRRGFLYDHPRVRTLGANDSADLASALAAPYDVLVNLFQPEAPDFTYNPEAQILLDRLVATRPPALRIDGDAGRACEGRRGRRSPFLFQRVEIRGREIAAERQLDTALVESIYDPAQRLVAELGLAPSAPGTRGPSVFAAGPSREAEQAWRNILGDHSGPGARPVVLLNPFGGSEPAKGFLGQEALLAAEVEGLVREGYRVVMLPSSHTWGRADTVAKTLALVDASAREYVHVAMEPVARRHAGEEIAPEPTESVDPDLAMRHFTYFAAYADLIVTVEGWLAHLAFALNRPFRLFLAAGSFPSEWFPRPRSATQRLVMELSPGGDAPYARSALLGEHDPPPLAHRPRKTLLEMALTGLADLNDPRALPLLRRAVTSPDPHVRTWAFKAVGRTSPLPMRGELLAALNDRWAGVVGAAAEALLAGDVDCSRELGPDCRQRLKLHVHIARQEWAPVRAAGAAALSALFRASHDAVYDVRAGAKDLLRELLPAYMKGRPAIERP